MDEFEKVDQLLSDILSLFAGQKENIQKPFSLFVYFIYKLALPL